MMADFLSGVLCRMCYRHYTPAGKKRTGNAKYTNVVGAPGTICAFSEIITQEDGVFDNPNLMRKARVYE